MANYQFLPGDTSKTINVFIPDSSSSLGGGLTGLVFNTASLTAYYSRAKEAGTAITLATQTATGAYSSGGFVVIDGTNMPGWYRLDVPNAVLAAGVGNAIISLRGAANMVPTNCYIDLTPVATPTNITAGTITTVTTATNLTNERGKYANGAVWIGPAANTNTVNYTDGIITNPVSTIAAAKTIADNLGLRRFFTTRTGTTQIGADIVGYDFDGANWSVTTTGGSRDVGTSHFLDASVVGGTFAGTSGAFSFEHSEFSTGVTIGISNLIDCRFAGTLTLSEAGNYDFIDCASIVAGTSVPVFAVPAGTVNISFRRWSGGMSITGITSGTTISIDVVSGGTITLAGADGNVQIRGMVAGITDNRTGAPTLGQNAAINITKINTEADTALADYDGPTNAEMIARTLVAANYFDPAADTVARVTLTDTVTTYTGNTPQTGDVFPLASTEIADIKAKTDLIPASPASTTNITAGTITTVTNLTTNNDKTGYALTAGEHTSLANDLLDLAAGVETGHTLRQSLRLMLASLAGKLSGAATTTVIIRDVNDTKNRITATVDADGNRTAITEDLT